MGQLIKVFDDASYIEYDRGSFDKWCVYEVRPNGYRRPPRDIDYFQTLKDLAEKYGANRVYHDFTKVYTWTDKYLSQRTLGLITELSQEYDEEDVVTVDKTFSIIYCGMIAEEQKKNTKLGKKIKRLGIHVLLIDNETVGYAANFMRGMGWQEIAQHCQERGF
jgi:hypothetical protein